jgi:hypothetical protein
VLAPPSADASSAAPSTAPRHAAAAAKPAGTRLGSIEAFKAAIGKEDKGSDLVMCVRSRRALAPRARAMPYTRARAATLAQRDAPLPLQDERQAEEPQEGPARLRLRPGPAARPHGRAPRQASRAPARGPPTLLGARFRRANVGRFPHPPRWTAKDLKTLCGWLSLAASGKKGDLQERIASFIGGGRKKKATKGAGTPTSAKKPKRESVVADDEAGESEGEDEEDDEEEEGGKAAAEEEDEEDEEDDDDDEGGEGGEGAGAGAGASSSSSSSSKAKPKASATDAALDTLRSALVDALPHLRGKPQRVVGGLVDAAWATFSAADKREACKRATAAPAAAAAPELAADAADAAAAAGDEEEEEVPPEAGAMASAAMAAASAAASAPEPLPAQSDASAAAEMA